MKVKMYLPSARKLVESKGLSKDGAVHMPQMRASMETLREKQFNLETLP